MTKLVVITQVPALGFVKGDVVTDDVSVLQGNPRAVVKSSAYIAGLVAGSLRHAFVAQNPVTGTPVIPSPTDLTVAAISESINYAATSLSLTPAQVLLLVQTQLGVTVQGTVASTTASSTSVSSAVGTLHSTFAAFGLLGAATN